MTFQELIVLVKRYRLLIVAIVLLVVGAVVADGLRQRYDASITIFVNREGIQQTEEYAYAGYYELESSGQFALTIEGFFKSPELVRAMFSEGDGAPPREDISALTTFFEAESVSSQQIEVRFEARSEDDARAIGRGARTVVECRVRELNELQRDDERYAVLVSDAFVVRRSSMMTVRVVCGAFAGFIIALVVVGGVHVVRSSRSVREGADDVLGGDGFSMNT